MRLGWAATALAIGLACGCGAGKKQVPLVGEDEITAAHLRSLGLDDSPLRHLSPTEDEARALAEQDGSRPMDAADHTLEEEPGTREKWEQASIAVLQVAVTVGAMVAPYFLF